MVVNISSYPIGVSSQPKNKQNKLAKTQTLPSYTSRSVSPYPLNTHRAYSQVKFGRSLAEHASWGAAVLKNGDVNFKLLTFPDVKKVFVQLIDDIHPSSMAHHQGDLVPHHDANGEIKGFTSQIPQSRFIELKKTKDSSTTEGVFEHLAHKSTAKNGQSYRWVIVRGNDTVETVKDPNSMRQPTIFSWSKIYDHHAFKWSDQDWMANKVKDRISRKHAQNGLKDPKSMKILKIHPATFTKEGSLDALIKALPRIKKDGYDAIEYLPLGNTHGFNWGYDEVDKMAIQESVLGGPDALKRLNNAVHDNGLNAFADVVLNHVGPDGNFLSKTGPYITGAGQWGDEFNYEGAGSKYVRDYAANIAINMAENYHVDGIRFDMTKYMHSDPTMKKVAMEMHEHYPDVVLIAEDGRFNDARVTRPLLPHEEKSATEADHVELMEDFDAKIFHKDPSIYDNIGFDSQWDFPYFHELTATAFDGWDNKPRNLYNLDGATRGALDTVKYDGGGSHDERTDGLSAIARDFTQKSGLFLKVKGSDEAEKGQRAARFGQAVCEAIATGKAKTMRPGEWLKLHQDHHMKEIIPLPEAQRLFDNARRMERLTIADTRLTKGPVMDFQGSQKGAIEEFRFAREFSTPEDIEAESQKKGYRVGIEGFLASKQDSIPYSPEHQKKMLRHELFVRTINKMRDKVPAMKPEGEIVFSVIHPDSKVKTSYQRNGQSEIYAVENFDTMGYQGDYNMYFPEGQWRQILNSEDKRFGGTGDFQNKGTISAANGDPKISIPPCGVVIFERINPEEIKVAQPKAEA